MRIWCTGALLVVLFVWGCDDGNTENTGEGPELVRGEAVSQTIAAAEGGTITSVDGRFTLTIPAGALAEDTEITVTDMGEPLDLVWELQPEGLAFLSPVAGSVRLTATDLESMELDVGDVYLFPATNSGDGTVEVARGVRQGPTETGDALQVDFELEHFSLLRTNCFARIRAAVPVVVEMPYGLGYGATRSGPDPDAPAEAEDVDYYIYPVGQTFYTKATFTFASRELRKCITGAGTIDYRGTVSLTKAKLVEARLGSYAPVKTKSPNPFPINTTLDVAATDGGVGDEHTIRPSFYCSAEGLGSLRVDLSKLELTGTFELAPYARRIQDGDITHYFYDVSGPTITRELTTETWWGTVLQRLIECVGPLQTGCATDPGCGAAGEPCCEDGTCNDGGECVDRECRSAARCGTAGDPCCEGRVCDADLQCTEAGRCRTAAGCGGPREPCCDGACTGGLSCVANTIAAALGGGLPEGLVDKWWEAVIDGEPTQSSATEGPQEMPRETETIFSILDPMLDLSPAAATRIFETEIPCGDGPHGTTFCASTEAPPSGRWVLLVNDFAAPIQLDDSAGSYQFGFVFDTDGNESNNYVPSAEYENDFFLGTDLWYELTHNPTDGWQVSVRDFRAGFADVPSHARFVVVGRQLGLLIPASELEVEGAGYRTSAFWHTGDYGLSGGPWSGDYYPLLGVPLMPSSAADTTYAITE